MCVYLYIYENYQQQCFLNLLNNSYLTSSTFPGASRSFLEAGMARPVTGLKHQAVSLSLGRGDTSHCLACLHGSAVGSFEEE